VPPGGQTDTAVTQAILQALLISGLIITLASIGRGLFAYGQTYLSQSLSLNIAFDLRNDIFSKIQRLSFSYHDSTRTGQLMVRATDDVERLRVFIGQGVILALQALLLMVGTLILLFFTNVRLTLYILPILPITLVLFMFFGRIAQPLFREVQSRLGKVNNSLQENLAGLRVVKAFAREPYEQTRFNESLADLLEQRLRINRIFSMLFPFIFVIANLGQAAVLYFGGVQIIEGNLTLGEWQKFSLYLIYLFFPLGQLGFIISLMAQAGASAERIFEILDAKNEVENKPDALVLTEVRGDVTFQDVSFRYFSSSELVLAHVSFTAVAGETIALLGATGSGKSSIISLIPRFYDVTRGQVLIDGHDVREVHLESLRRHIGIVLQETNLFSGTIRENIAFGRPQATDEEVMAAAQAAAAHEFIMSFPDGYNTAVGERGTTLSGGQRQRIAIARALLLNPRILILDDSTSSVDLKTEYEIQQALDRLMAGRTSFVIAQRISTVVNADKILVLDQGQVVGMGTHEELLENNAIYADIYYSQLMPDTAVDEEAPHV
jgi:ATP-binding cassette, subfamily B, multidrug efflux pump